MNISIATSDDLEAINRVKVDICHDKTTGYEIAQEESSDSIIETEKQITYVCKINGDVKGFISVHGKSQFSPANEAEFELFVMKNGRGKGVGRALLKKAVNYISNHSDYSRLTLHVLKSSIPAIGLYESTGFNTLNETDGKGKYMFLDVN